MEPDSLSDGDLRVSNINRLLTRLCSEEVCPGSRPGTRGRRRKEGKRLAGTPRSAQHSQRGITAKVNMKEC